MRYNYRGNVISNVVSYNDGIVLFTDNIPLVIENSVVLKIEGHIIRSKIKKMISNVK